MAWFDQEIAKDGKVLRRARVAFREVPGNPGFTVILQTNWDPQEKTDLLDDFAQIVLGLKVAADK